MREAFEAEAYDEALALTKEKVRASGVAELMPIVDFELTDSPSITLDNLNEFLEECDDRIVSIFLQMNGFDLNHDRWFFDCLAYRSYQNEDADLDWLADWQAEWVDYGLDGAEGAQAAFRWYHEEKVFEKRPEIKDTYRAARLVVLCKFVCFARDVLAAGELARNVVVLVSAHDFELIARMNRGALTRGR